MASVWLWSGEFHYYRLPNPELWREQLEKFKAVGFNAVSLYFDWAYHSPRPGVYDFTGVRDVDRLLDIAAEVGIYVIARPGPYINAEVDGGGFPGWLSTTAGNTRTDTLTVTYTPDTTLPSITILTPTSASTLTTTASTVTPSKSPPRASPPTRKRRRPCTAACLSTNGC